MKIIELEQNSPEWFQFRLGKITGSRLASIWSSRAFTVADIEKLLVGRGFDLAAFQAELNEKRKAEGLKPKKYVKAELEKVLTDDDLAILSSDAEKKLEFYQILADQVAIKAEDDETQYRSAMDRGHELEDEASQRAATVLGKEVFKVGCVVADIDERIINSPDRLIKPAGKGRIIREAMEVKCLDAAKHLMAFFERQIPEDYWTQKVQYFVTNERLEKLYWVFYNPRVPMLPIFILVVERKDLGHWPETMTKYQLRTLAEIDVLRERLLDEADNVILPAKPEKGVLADV